MRTDRQIFTLCVHFMNYARTTHKNKVTRIRKCFCSYAILRNAYVFSAVERHNRMWRVQRNSSWGLQLSAIAFNSQLVLPVAIPSPHLLYRSITLPFFFCFHKFTTNNIEHRVTVDITACILVDFGSISSPAVQSSVLFTFKRILEMT
jgi:hypothetical protein